MNDLDKKLLEAIYKGVSLNELAEVVGLPCEELLVVDGHDTIQDVVGKFMTNITTCIKHMRASDD